MASVPPDTGFSLTLPWGVIEWALTGIIASGIGVAMWVWRLGGKVAHLEEQNERLVKKLEEQSAKMDATVSDLKGETRQAQQIMRSVGNALDHKMTENLGKIESRMDRMSERLEQVRMELPSQSFIEGQLQNITSRLDRAAENLARRQD